MAPLVNITLYRCEYIERCLGGDTSLCIDLVLYECDSYMTATFYFDSNPLGPPDMYKMGLKVSGATGEAKLKVRH